MTRPPLDLGRLAEAFAPKDQKLRFRFGKVVSVENDRTCTVTIGGDTTNVSGIRYFGTPLPGAAVVVATDGLDVFVMGHLGAEGRTLAPRASRSTDQNISNATDENITFDGVQYDAWGCWSSGAATRLTAPLTGRYTATGVVSFASNATGNRSAAVIKNGTSTVGRIQVLAASGGPTWLTVQAQPFDMVKGDYIQLQVRQTSGGVLAANNSSTFAPSLSLVYLGP